MSLTLSKIKLGPDLDTGLREALGKGEAVAFYFAADSREIALLIHNNDVVGDDIHPDEREVPPLATDCLTCLHPLNNHSIEYPRHIGDRGSCSRCSCSAFR